MLIVRLLKYIWGFPNNGPLVCLSSPLPWPLEVMCR